MVVEEIVKWAGLYIGIGFLFTIYETIEIIDKGKERSNTINRIKVIIGWLPAIFNKKAARWLLLKKGNIKGSSCPIK